MADILLKRIRKDPEIKDLRAKRKRFKNSKNYAGLSDIYCEMGDCLRRLRDETSSLSCEVLDRKISRKYANSIEMGKLVGNYENCSLASRALAELAMDQDTEEAFINIENSMRYALKSKNPSFIQLAFHQCAYIFSARPEYLEKAAEIAERGLVYLRDHSAEINADAAAVDAGGDSARRKAGLENLLGGIYLDLNDETNARLHNERCLDYTNESSDYELHCRALMLKLRMTYGQDRLNVALEIKETTEKLDKKSPVRFEADFHLGAESLRCNKFWDAKSLLWRLHSNYLNRLDDDLRRLIRKYLIFIFKSERRLQKVKEEMASDDGVDRRELWAQIYEKIADEATEIQLNELAFVFYEKMLQLSASVEQKRLALLSLAETAREMKNFSLSVHFFQELLKTERKLGYSVDKLLSTEISISIVSASIVSISVQERLQMLEDTYQKCTTNVDKEVLLTNYVEFLEKNIELCNERELEEKRHELKQLHTLNNSSENVVSSQSSEDSLTTSNYIDEWDNINELEIFEKMKVEMKLMDEEIQLTKCIDARVNNEGETRLHLEARSENYEMLKKLVEKGYNVNARDHGGWTPLSEAVSAGKLRNARFLLQHGADVNCRSIQGVLMSDEEEGASGHTPLMEACANGNIAMVKMLIAFKANVTQKDDDGWTSVDFLKEYLRTAHDLNVNHQNEVLKCIDFMEKQQVKAGFTPRKSPPLRQKKKKFISRINRKRAAFEIDENYPAASGTCPSSGELRSKSLEQNRNSKATDGFNSDDSMDRLLISLCKSTTTKTVIATEDKRNLEEYCNTIQALSRRQHNKSTYRNAPATSSADARDRSVVDAYNKIDSIQDLLPADREFIAPDDEENDGDVNKSESQSTYNSGTILQLHNDSSNNNEDDILTSIRTRRLKRPRLR